MPWLDEAALDLIRAYVRHAPWSAGKRALVERHLNAALRDRPLHRLARTRFGATFAVDTQDLIQRYLYLFGVWEPHMTRWLQRRLRPGDVFVDVGANIGYYSILASRLVGPGGTVVAVEASPTFHQLLLRHARRNRSTNIRAVNAAVSDRDELLTFILASSRNMGANSIVPYDGPAESTFDIAARPLPDLLTEDEIARARVIKIDVEGAEGGVVRGLIPLLPRLRPDAELTIEVTPERMADLGESVEELLETLTSHGFHTYHLTNDYAAATYPPAIHGPARVPRRWHGPVTAESDLIFSRVDAATLP
ncbi:FkbM family methyltransferase [Streptomyces himastatinicus]|nr:FkbM family methyltransferase [Streptomyces himastatinicus]